MRRALALLLTSAAAVGCSKPGNGQTSADDAGTGPAAAPSASPSSEAAKEPERAPPTPKELHEQQIEQHRDEMRKAVADERYDDVCAGTPWVNSTLCSWVAARAAGKAAARPSGELFKAFFQKEHWKRVSGRNITGVSNEQSYEVTASGYRNHCLLETIDTRFTSEGRFTMWVQEQPETREVPLSSGSTANWVVLEEAVLATSLMSLAHSGSGIEGKATAKDAILQIATYQSYAELKGEFVPIPGQKVLEPAVVAPVAPAVSSTGAEARPSPATVSEKPAAAVAASVATKKSASDRAACMSTCIKKCADDAGCERACVGKCP